MTSGASNFLLNIVELQNTITSASGLSPVASLSNTVSQLQQMVIFDEKRIAVNTISKFNTSPIQVVDSMNFASNTSLTLNGTTVGSGTASFGQVSTIGYTPSLMNYYSTIDATSTAIEVQVGSPPQYPMSFLANGTTIVSGPLTITGAGTPGLGYYLTCMDTLGTAQWQAPGAPSDMRLKTNIRTLDGAGDILEGIRGVRFDWLTGGSDVGVIAQEVGRVLPEAVHGDPFVVEYHKIIPVLVETVKELLGRVSTLEATAEERL